MVLICNSSMNTVITIVVDSVIADYVGRRVSVLAPRLLWIHWLEKV